MQIEKIYGTTSTTGTAPVKKKTTRAAEDTSAPDFDESQSLDAALKNTTGVRADQVAKAKELAKDPNYPSDAQLEKLANVLAKNWK